MNDIVETVVDNLYKYSKMNGLTNKAVAREIGVSEPTVSQWFNGKKACKTRYIERISIFTGIPVPALFVTDSAFGWKKPLRKLLKNAS